MLRFLPNYRVHMQKNPRGYKEPRTYTRTIKPLGNQNPLSLKFLAAAKVVDTVSGTSTDILVKELGASLAQLRAKERQCERRLPLVTDDEFDEEMTLAQDYATYFVTNRLQKVFQVSKCLDSILLPLYFTAALSVLPIPTAIEKFSILQLGYQIKPLQVEVEHFNGGKPAYSHLMARVQPQGTVPRSYVEELIKMRRRGNSYALKTDDLAAEIGWRSGAIRWPATDACGMAVSLFIAVVELAKVTDARTASIIDDIDFMGRWEEAV